MGKFLGALGVGESGKVKAVLGEGRVKRRLFDMGVTPGADVTLVKRAPLGDPLEVNLRGYQLSLRKSEAGCIETEAAK